MRDHERLLMKRTPPPPSLAPPAQSYRRGVSAYQFTAWLLIIVAVAIALTINK